MTSTETDDLIEIDGSMLEGGGQILRIATTLSCKLSKSIKIVNIRHKRPKPGLAAQHLTSIQSAINFYTNIKTTGIKLGSTSISIDFNSFFVPELRSTSMIEKIDIGTAGAITLVLQTIFPIILDMESGSIQIIGGTRTNWSPWVDYFQNIFLPMSKCQNFVKFSTIKQGFFPVGGGQVILEKVHRINNYGDTIESDTENLHYDYCEFGEIAKVELLVTAHGKMRNSAQQIADLIVGKMKSSFNIVIDVDRDVSVSIYSGKGASCGAMLTVISNKGFKKAHSDMIENNQSFRDFTDKVTVEFYEKVYLSKSCVDDNMADQLIVFMALGRDNSKIRCNYPLTLHTQTAMAICSKFIERNFVVTPDGDDEEVQTCVVSCTSGEIKQVTELVTY